VNTLELETPRLGARDALLVGLALGTLVAGECVWLAVLIEGSHHAALLRDPIHLAPLWLLYGAAFAVPALLGWAAARALAPRAGRLGSLFALLLPCLAPVINGALATRSVLQTALATPVGAAVALGVTALAAAWLARVVRPGREHAGQITLAGLLWAPQALCAANVISVFRPPQEFAAPRGLAVLAAACLAAALLTIPLYAALRSRPPKGPGRRLLGALASYALVLLLPIWIGVIPEPLGTARASLAGAGSASPSVLLIVVDTLRADALAGFGGDPSATPSVASLARDASVFARAYAAAPWTTPSFASILTSSYPSQHQAGRRDPALDFKYAMIDSLPTLAEVLHEHGYWTGAALSNAYLAKRMGLARGFDDYENLVSLQWQHPVLVGLAARGLIEIPPYVAAAAQTRRILELVRRGAASGGPFFVLAHYMDPHAPHWAHAGFDRGAGQSPAERYRGEVSYTDHHLGILIRELQARGLYDDLLIVLTADHGEELTEGRNAGDFGHGHTLFDEVLHVPLLVKQPGGGGAGTRNTQPVSGIDVAPTILQLVGIDVPAEFQGRPLLGLEANRDPERILFSERLLYGREQKAAISGDVKVILETSPDGVVHTRVYDRALDPGETSPLAADAPRFQHLASALVRFSENAGPEQTARVDFDDLERQSLEALGYVD
jgi:arylsulfatase A-like enzyme